MGGIHHERTQSSIWLVALAILIAGVAPRCSFLRKRSADKAIRGVTAVCEAVKTEADARKAMASRFDAEAAVGDVDLVEQHPYRVALDEAWKPCIGWQARNNVGEPPPKTASYNQNHAYTIKMAASQDAVFGEPGLYFPYPDDLPPDWRRDWGHPYNW